MGALLNTHGLFSCIFSYHSRRISPLLQVYLPPRFKNMCSSKPLKTRALSTPTSRTDRDGSLLPFVQSRNRICKYKSNIVVIPLIKLNAMIKVLEKSKMFSKKNMANNLIHLKWVLYCIVI